MPVAWTTDRTQPPFPVVPQPAGSGMAADALTSYPPVGAGTGNRCGHERAAPDLDPRWTPGHNRHQIRVLDHADRKIEALYGRAHGRVHRAWRPIHAARQARVSAISGQRAALLKGGLSVGRLKGRRAWPRFPGFRGATGFRGPGR